MIRDMLTGKKSAYDQKKQEKLDLKAKESARLPSEVTKELEVVSSLTGQKHHQIECGKYELKQLTMRMNDLLLELKNSRLAHGDNEGAEALNVVP